MFAFANPKRFMDLSAALLPWLVTATVLTLGAGVVLGFLAPPDYQQVATRSRSCSCTCRRPGPR